MHLRRYIIPFFFLALSLGTAVAQSNESYCGYTGYSPWLDWYQKNKDLLTSRDEGDTAWLYVPVIVHIVGTDNGTGYYPEHHIFRILCEMNEQYVPAHIRFYLDPSLPFVYHNNSSWYEHDFSKGAEMINSTRIDGRLNAYVVSDPAGNCGYSWMDAIVLGKNCSGSGNTTWAHETGHHLSLPHPFYGWENISWNYSQPAPFTVGPDQYPVEKTDHSNCSSSGDRFCDTDPDYLNYRWQCDNNQQSQVLQKDPNGISFRSDASLIMGYANDACASRFTPEQIAAMRANLQTEHADYLVQDTPGASIPDDAFPQLISPIDSHQVQYNDLVLNWEPVENATFYAVQISLYPGFPMYIYNEVVENVSSVEIQEALPNNRLLYWRVRAYNDWSLCQASAWQTGVFKTKNLTATNELEKIATIELNPNPVQCGNPALLLIQNDEKLNMRLLLSDVSGKHIFEQQSKISPGEQILEIPTSNLAAGMYILSLQSEKGSVIKKLVVTE